MTTYLFVTKSRYEPESVDSEEGATWSCNKFARAGDSALVYVTGQGISFEWEITSDAEESAEWGYSCSVAHRNDFYPPISIQELRAAIPAEAWKPPHLNFRGYRSIAIPDEVVVQIRTLRESGPSTLAQLESALAKQVRESLALPSKERLRRLRAAEKHPKKVQVATSAFVRNPDVVAEVLLRANGRCERCKKEAPFLRASDGTPYLEIHHKVRLADRGEDAVDNAQALCPNCHRHAHFGSGVGA